VGRQLTKLLFLSYPSDWTGPTQSLLLLLRDLRDRYDITVLLPGHGPFTAALEQLGIRYVSFPKLTKWELPAMIRLVRSRRYHLLYANTTHSSSRLALLAARCGGARYVCHVRAMGSEASWPDLWYLRMADAVVAVSEACAHSVQRFVRGVRLHVAYNGIDERRWKEPPRAATSALNAGLELPESAFVVTSVAHIAPRKGQEFAVAAMPGILDRVPQAHLILLGSLTRDPSYLQSLRERVRTPWRSPIACTSSASGGTRSDGLR
jgi:glycosyltransferase involved in cell wall biosynthesis